MITLYQCTIFVSLALLAIVIAIFVFALSFYRGALEFSARQEEDALNRRKELIESRKTELAKKMPGIEGSTFSKQLRAELDKFDAELKNIDQSILKSRNKAKALTARNMVIIPSSFLLVSIITSGIAIATSGALPAIMWGLSLALLVTGSYFICRNLCTVEFFSGVIDLGTLMEQALEKHAQKMRPIVDLDIWDFELIIKRGETKEMHPALFLKQGLTAKNIKIRFSGTQELDFPEEKYGQSEFDHKNMRKPKQFWYKEIGDLNYGVYLETPFKVKAPDAKGEYTMTYWVHCDEFTSEEKPFTIKVI